MEAEGTSAVAVLADDFDLDTGTVLYFAAVASSFLHADGYFLGVINRDGYNVATAVLVQGERSKASALGGCTPDHFCPYPLQQDNQASRPSTQDFPKLDYYALPPAPCGVPDSSGYYDTD